MLVWRGFDVKDGGGDDDGDDQDGGGGRVGEFVGG